MIHLTRLNGTRFVLNAEKIVMVEATPDTIVTLGRETTFRVKETVDEVIRLVIRYRRRIHRLPRTRTRTG
ncbi:MAG TPA: flagellar FlbD family protein [Candidatus Ozemobacteraceae bacterium]|nr:flagellar FlbD family protein [Candidatus Ozemobacteraceae bacterium]